MTDSVQVFSHRAVIFFSLLFLGLVIFWFLNFMRLEVVCVYMKLYVL